MTDYLEELMGGRDLLEALKRLEGGGAVLLREEAVSPLSERRRAKRGTPPDASGTSGILQEEQSLAGGRAQLLLEEPSAGERREGAAFFPVRPKKEGAEPPLEEAGPEEETSLPLLEELERLERASAVLEEGGAGRLVSSSMAGGQGGGQAGYPLELSRIPGETPELYLPAGQGWGSFPDSAQESPGGALSLAEQTDQAFRRDSRRYDGGFFLY